MATKTNPIRPFIFKFTDGDELSDNQFVYLQPDRYYWYTVSKSFDDTNLNNKFIGKTWCSNNENGLPEITINIQDIAESYFYDSFHSLKPIFNPETQRYILFPTENNGYAYAVEGYKNNPEKVFGRLYFFVRIFNDPAVGRVSDALFYDDRECTSSWNIIDDVYGMDDSYVFQNLLDLEFNGFVSHYPKVYSDNFSLSWLMNVSDSFVTSGFNYRFGNNNSEYLVVNPGYNTTNMQIPSLSGGYVPFNIRLSDILPFLHTVYSEPVPFEQIIGANSSQTIYNRFLTGTSEPINYTNQWIGGNSKPHSPSIPSVNETNSIFVWPSNDYSNRIHIAELDECPSKYYLKWMTKSCVPVCYGFNGKNTEKYDFNTTYMTNVLRNEELKINEVTRKWTLNSGVINKQTYAVMFDMFTSPYVILYDLENDLSYNVKIETKSGDLKKSVLEDRRPFNFTIDIVETDQTKLMY